MFIQESSFSSQEYKDDSSRKLLLSSSLISLQISIMTFAVYHLNVKYVLILSPSLSLTEYHYHTSSITAYLH